MADFDERDKQFYILFEKLVAAMVQSEKDNNVSLVKSVLGELAEMLRLSKGVTMLYRSPLEEKNGSGEMVSGFGDSGNPVYTVRHETKLMSIVSMTVYMKEDEPPLTEHELERLDLVLRASISYISRTQLEENAEKIAFYDEQGFKNYRSFYKFLFWRDRPDSFDGLAAINYNLRHFSLVNDEIGRPNGDIVMMNHYKTVESMVGERGIVIRLGGDSFVAVCEKENLPDGKDNICFPYRTDRRARSHSILQ